MQKLFCYVDESGQDTAAQKGRDLIFVVAVAVLEGEREKLMALCEQYEKVSGKGMFKWGKAEHIARLRYLRLIFADNRFQTCLRFAVFRNVTKQFDQATVQAIARAVRWKTPTGPYVANVYVDGLAKSRRSEYRQALRQSGISMGEVRGVAREASNPLVRLADAIAGFIRDARGIEDAEATRLLQDALKNSEVVEV